MVPNRLVLLLGAGLLTASAAWADGVGYVDCASHPEDTQVFAKPRRTPDAVAAIPCGERFTLLLNGFIFSRVQTRNGQIGYVYSSIISMDRSGAAVQPPTTTRLSAASTPQPAANVVDPKPTGSAPAPDQSSIQQAPVQQPVPQASARAPETAATVQANSSASVSVQPAPAVAQAQVPAGTTTVPSVTATPAQVSTPASPSREQLEAQASAALSAAHPEASAAAPVATAQPETAPAAAPETSAARQPEAAPAEAARAEAAPAEAAPAEPAAPAIRAEKARESWERPNAGGRRLMPLFELYGGYAFTRFDGGPGVTTNFNGVLGSFGWNVKRWLQIVADSSYSVVTVSGTKNVLYGNHWGPRLFLRGHGKWSMTPFVEGLVGGTRADTTISGVGGYSTSANCISYKVGGGLDIKPSRHLEIRVLNVDYYRTSFGTSVYQNNYWASAGIVLRLFGGSE